MSLDAELLPDGSWKDRYGVFTTSDADGYYSLFEPSDAEEVRVLATRFRRRSAPVPVRPGQRDVLIELPAPPR